MTWEFLLGCVRHFLLYVLFHHKSLWRRTFLKQFKVVGWFCQRNRVKLDRTRLLILNAFSELVSQTPPSEVFQILFKQR